MRQVKDAVQKVQALLGDPRGQWVKKGYVMPILDLTYGALYLNLKNASAKNLQAVVPIYNIPAGTQSLAPWQGYSMPPGAGQIAENAPAIALYGGTGAGGQNPPAYLAGMYDPIDIWVKPAGAPVAQYTRAIGPRDTLPHVDPNFFGPNAFGIRIYFAWVGGRLSITPVNAAIDLEVTAKFNPIPLTDDDQLLYAAEDVWIPLCFKTAAICGVERSNPQILAGYMQQAQAAEDNLIADLMRIEQGNASRFQRVSREGGLIQWFWSI